MDDTPDNSQPAAEADVHHKIGLLTRQLHDSLNELGYADKLRGSMGELPDAQSRLSYIARLTGEDPLSLTALCELLGSLTPILHRPMKTVSPAQRAAVAWCLAAGVTCDTYIADDTIGFGLDRQRDLGIQGFGPAEVRHQAASRRAR